MSPVAHRIGRALFGGAILLGIGGGGVLPCTAPAAERSLAAAQPPATQPGLEFIHSGFENASPIQWEIDREGTIHVYLLYDYERASANRAAGHWHFQLQGKPGTDLTLVLHNFDNIYNGKPGPAVSNKSICYVSADGKKWSVLGAELLPGNALRVRVHLDGPSLYLARLEPYRLSDLDRLLDEIRGNRLVEITTIGRSVEGRPLEIVRVGDPGVPYRVLLRARAHAWEPGGNWVVQGLIRGLLSDDPVARKCLARYCVYVMPMANKDGVARGRTRFNMLGRDLNRNWDQPSDPRLAPENFALETWLRGMIEQGRRPNLVIDLHNDEGGGLAISRPPVKNLAEHVDRMHRLERLMNEHTWFTEGSSGPSHRNPGSIGEGLLERYGIDACILELNCNWIAGTKQHPSGEAWEQFGRQLREVFFEYFEPPAGQPSRSGKVTTETKGAAR
jgi:hypothetical protein